MNMGIHSNCEYWSSRIISQLRRSQQIMRADKEKLSKLLSKRQQLTEPLRNRNKLPYR